MSVSTVSKLRNTRGASAEHEKYNKKLKLSTEKQHITAVKQIFYESVILKCTIAK